MDYITRHCPACGSQKANQAIISDKCAEKTEMTELESCWRGFFKEKVIFSYYRCECGLLYCPIFFNDAQLQYLYANMEDNTANVPVSVLSKTQKKYFSELKKHSRLTGSYLELGPDIGLFAKCALNEKESFEKYWFFEPNKAVWNTLTDEFKNSEVKLSASMSNFDEVPDNSISVCTAIHVLDHLIDPVDTLRALKKKMTQDGRLLFVTHDERSMLARLLKKKWPPYCLQHPQLFNPASISALLKKAGYQVVQVKKCYNYFPVMYLLKHLLWAVGFKKVKLPDWNFLSLGLKLGNIVTIAKPL